MTRAGRVCMVPGCPRDTIEGSPRCDQHQPPPRPHGWATSAHQTPPRWVYMVRRIMARDRHRCRICGHKADVIDHLLPQAWGGGEDAKNLRAMCFRCHRAKVDDEKRLGKQRKNMPAGEWLPLLDVFLERWKA